FAVRGDVVCVPVGPQLGSAGRALPVGRDVERGLLAAVEEAAGHAAAPFALSRSSRLNRRCPPRVRIAESLPSCSQRRTVPTLTPRIFAASPIGTRSASLPWVSLVFMAHDPSHTCPCLSIPSETRACRRAGLRGLADPPGSLGPSAHRVRRGDDVPADRGQVLVPEGVGGGLEVSRGGEEARGVPGAQ